MLHPRRRLRLFDERVDEVRVVRELRLDPLHRDGAREAHRADEAAEVHGRASACRERPEDRVASDDAGFAHGSQSYRWTRSHAIFATTPATTTRTTTRTKRSPPFRANREPTYA